MALNALVHFEVSIIIVRIVDIRHLPLCGVIVVCACIFLEQLSNAILAVFPLAFDWFLLELLSYILEVFEMIKLQFNVLLLQFHLFVFLSEWLPFVQLFYLLSTLSLPLSNGLTQLW